jgi:hypothetical protein
MSILITTSLIFVFVFAKNSSVIKLSDLIRPVLEIEVNPRAAQIIDAKLMVMTRAFVDNNQIGELVAKSELNLSNIPAKPKNVPSRQSRCFASFFLLSRNFSV